VSPAVQAQTPLEHANPSAVSQVTPHPPQLFESLWSGRQLPLQ
jgi:hypothetical protein